MSFIYNLTATWNDGASVLNGIKMNVTNTASAANSKLMDLQLAGATIFNVDKNSNVGLGIAAPIGRLHVFYTSTDPSLSGTTGSGLVLHGSSTLRVHFGSYPAGSFAGWVQSSDAVGSAYPFVINPLGGNVGIGVGATNPGSKLTIMGGSLNKAAYTVATLPGSPVTGDEARVTNALGPVFGSTVVGGGAVNVPVFWNGANWIVG